MDQAGITIADAVLGIDTLWGGDVMCPSGTGRFIADSWFSDEPLPAAYTHPRRAACASPAASRAKLSTAKPSTSTCAPSTFPRPSPAFARRQRKLSGLREPYLAGLAVSLRSHVRSGHGGSRQRRSRSLRALRRGLHRQAAGAIESRAKRERVAELLGRAGYHHEARIA